MKLAALLFAIIASLGVAAVSLLPSTDVGSPADTAAAGYQGGDAGGHDQCDLVRAIGGIGSKQVNRAPQHQYQENDDRYLSWLAPLK